MVIHGTLDLSISFHFETTKTISDAAIVCLAIFAHILNLPCINMYTPHTNMFVISGYNDENRFISEHHARNSLQVFFIKLFSHI